MEKATPKMVDFAECAGPSGGKGVTPPSRKSLQESCNGDFRLERDLQWRFSIGKRFAMEIFNGDLQWRFSMEILD